VEASASISAGFADRDDVPRLAMAHDGRGPQRHQVDHAEDAGAADHEDDGKGS
jgi:hypothetical protein